MTTNSFDLIIIGGGILGSAVSFFAARAGLKTALLEQRASLAAHTTSKAVSCFRMQWGEPDFLYLMQNSIEVYEHFGEITGLGAYDLGIHHNGWLFATADESGPDRLQSWIDAQRALGVTDSEYLTGVEARSRFPFLSPNVTAATFRARDGWLSPYEAAAGFVRAAQRCTPSFQLMLDTPVKKLVIESDKIIGVETADQKIYAPKVVVCAGPHSKAFAAQVGISLPVDLVRRQRAFIATSTHVPSDAPMVADDDTGAYWRPETGGAFLGWALDEPAQPPINDVPADSDFAAIALDACSRLTPFWNDVAAHLNAKQVSVAAGQYSITPDGKPLIGESEISGLNFLSGDNGFGIESAPQAARHLVQLLTGELDPTTNPFRLNRPMHKMKKLVL